MVLLDSSSPEQFTAIPAYAGQYAVMRRGLALLPTLARARPGRLLAASAPPRCRRATRSRRLTSTAARARNGRDEISMVPEVFEQAQALTTLRRPPARRADRLGEPRRRRAGPPPRTSSRRSRPTSRAPHRRRPPTPGCSRTSDGAAESVRAITDVVAAVRTGTALATP